MINVYAKDARDIESTSIRKETEVDLYTWVKDFHIATLKSVFIGIPFMRFNRYVELWLAPFEANTKYRLELQGNAEDYDKAVVIILHQNNLRLTSLAKLDPNKSPALRDYFLPKNTKASDECLSK